MPLTPQQARSLAEQLLDDEDDPADASSGPPAPACDAQDQGLPQYIGPYRIVGVIASGGMGVVYEAEQEHPRRVVALKVLKHGLTSPSALRRFEHEAQILARLRHDGIAHIYDAGMHDDPSTPGEPVPYFVMEYVPNARSIVQFADDHKLSIRGRLELFSDVCDAVHHGHQKGIIHRDLKPANILVEGTQGQTYKAASVSGGGRGRIKIIDFGIARATDSDVALTTLQTDVRELIGTLQYMSPEQCAGDPHDLDIRSDIYSLGVVLYELLTGHLPYDLSHKSLPSATRMIAEADPLPPSSFVRRLRGDLEAILLKALQKDREQRYQSAIDLCRDVQRYLQGEPIEARAPSRWSLSMRWVTRHPVVTTTAACLTIALLTLGATSLSVWYLDFRPHHIELTPDGREAWLMSVRNNILHTWRSEGERGIAFAELVERRPELGGGKLAIIGYTQNDRSALQSSLSAFDIQGDLDEPVWSKRVETEDILPELLARDFTGQQFGAQFSKLVDVFPEYPGPEIVVVFKHGPYSAGVIRIYDLTGDLLFQLWQDGGVNSSYWMSDAELLVFTGLDATAYWDERNHPEVKEAYPRIVFAVHPEPGHLGRRWINDSSSDEKGIVRWFRCILPPAASDVFSHLELISPLPGEDRGRFVRLRLQIDGPNAPDMPRDMSWLIDETGVEVRSVRVLADSYKRANAAGQARDPDIFYLGDLPPIISTSEPTDEDPDAGN